MSTLIFFAGAGFGILVMMIICGLFIALNRKQTKVQADFNKSSQEAMEEGNRLRRRRASAIDRIADSLEIIVQQKR